jgi:acetylornithine/N-succinyldiaminopimelate aminotransferase
VSNLLKVYHSFPLEIEKSHGIYIYSTDGVKYIDTFAGIGVSAFGHSHKELIECFQSKMSRYMHLSNFFVDNDAIYVSKKLVEFTGQEGKVFFTNSGTEATEALMKAIKKVSVSDKNKIIYFKNGFHGRTLGALSLNGFEKMRKAFEPLLPHTVELEFNNIEKFKDYMDKHGSEVIALFIEPLQGSGGVNPVTPEFSDIIMEYKEKYNYYLVSDEVQAGMGRTGEIYSYQHFSLKPDMVTVGKAIGGGLPLAAAIFLNETSEIFKSGDHGSTFAPNPVAMAGARYIVDNIPPMLSDIKEKGTYFIDKLRKTEAKYLKIKEIRGLGLMIGILLQEEDKELSDRMMKERHLLINALGNKLIRLLPPLNITYEEIDIIIKKLLE